MYRRLFSHKEENSSDYNKVDERVKKKKDKARVENAHTHSAVCVAGLAAAVAGAFFDHKLLSSSSEMSNALASATQLLASYCIEMAQQSSSSSDRDRVASVVRSALASPTPTHLSTLTAAAATALRGEAALRARLPNNNNNNNNKRSSSCSAAVSPHEKVAVAAYSSQNKMMEEEDEDEDEEDLTCQGDLLQLTSKGMLRWRHVAVYINKAYEVTIKLKSKHVVVGAFSKNNKSGVVYEVIEKSEEWPFKRENKMMMDNVSFGLKTSEGLLELKCNNNVHKQKWVYAIHKLLRRRRRFEQAENSLRMLHITNSI